MSNADINHSEEMERAYHEAYVAMKEISRVVQKMDFDEFVEWVDGFDKAQLAADIFNPIMIESIFGEAK